jgi:Tfp pilus assembly protein PilF
MRRAGPASAAALALWAVSNAGAEEQRVSVALATLNNGVSVGFALLRSGSQEAGESLGGVALGGAKAVSRVVVDREGGVFFGYRLEIDRAGSRQLRVTIRPLPGGVEKELEARLPCPSCPAPRPLAGYQPRFPPSQIVSDGASLSVDLLVNPTSGEKIVDVIMVSSQRVTHEATRAAAQRVAEAIEAAKKADYLVAKGAYDEAIEQLRRAAAINPSDAALWNKMGICYQTTRRLALAEEQYLRALKLNPQYAEVWNNLGSLEHGRSRFKQAVRDYEKAISMRPSFATAYKNLGAALFALGRFEDGFRALQEAFRIDPSALQASSGVGVGVAGMSPAMEAFYFAKIHAANGQVDSALALLMKAAASGFKDFDRVTRDPDFKAVVRDPRFAELTKSSSSAR